MADPAPLLRFCGIGKRFPGVVALHDVRFAVAAGTCHALMGENGAGKSTLGRILAGIYRPDAGHVELAGVACAFRSPLEAQRAGVGIVHQELSYCPNLSVAENLCLAALPRRGPVVDRRAMRAKAQRYLDAVGADCAVDEELGRLATGQVQMVQIAGALAIGARVLVLDEPTSSLTLSETRRLHALVRELRSRGTTILYVSHRLAEIFSLCDMVTVLRDGQHVATRPVAATTEDDLVKLMIGRTVARYFPEHVQREAGEEALRVENLCSPGKLHQVSLSVRRGEVVALAGLVGAGRSELAAAVFGLDPLARGRIYVGGRPVRIARPRDALRHGIGLVPEDRKRQGLVLDMSCGQNITLSCLDALLRLGLVRRQAERATVDRCFAALRVRAAGPDAAAATLSGGNQQKLVLAKWLARSCRVLILDEPTRGVDVGAKGEIHRLIDELAAAGHAIIMISSELPEVLNLATRIVVLRQGRVAGELSRAEADQEKVMQLMAGAGGSRSSKPEAGNQLETRSQK